VCKGSEISIQALYGIIIVTVKPDLIRKTKTTTNRVEETVFFRYFFQLSTNKGIGTKLEIIIIANEGQSIYSLAGNVGL
jgi:hypothetical protein